MKPSSIIAAVAVFAVIGGVGSGLAIHKQRADRLAASQTQAFEPAAAVQVVAAREVQWRPMADLVGTILCLRSVSVSNELAGRVREVQFESGAIIETGHVLLTLDDATDRADLAAMNASVRVAEAAVTVGDARLKLAESEAKRMEGASSKAVAEMEFLPAQSEADKARADRVRLLADVDLAKARAAQVQARLDKMVIKAPFRARAGLRTVHEGQYLVEGAQVVMLEEVSDNIYLDFAVPQEYVTRVKPGTAVMASSVVLGPQPVRIEVVAVDASVNYDTRNIRVRAIVENRQDNLRPGMFIQLRVPVEDLKPYVVVPATAVRRASYADQVFIIGLDASHEKLRASQRFVKLGPTVGDDVIILEGVKVGDQVAAVGSFKLRDGALINKVQPEPAKTALLSPPLQ